MKFLHYIPRFYRMEVKWVAGAYCRKELSKNHIQVVWIFKIWGNVRDIAIKKAEASSDGHAYHVLGYNCMTAYHSPCRFPKSFGF